MAVYEGITYSRQEVYAMYSESGFGEITQMKLVGLFDRRQDGATAAGNGNTI
ncbi:MAG: hypothetical protein IJ960_09060 [Oscillospiraceae bacterium]|nr:hypothetical protein [Oscillospiraceae bacterium]